MQVENSGEDSIFCADLLYNLSISPKILMCHELV